MRRMTPFFVTVVLLVLAAVFVRSCEASTVSQARAEVVRLWGSPSASRMLCIIARESSWDAAAVSHTDDHGLAQLHAPAWRRYFGSRWQLVYDPVANVRMAFVVYQRQGWGAWTTSRRC